MAKISQQVALKDVRFYAFHGYYPEEQLTGSVFYLDLETEFEVFGSSDDDLEKTVNYERLFAIADAEMRNTSKLIETVARNILNKVVSDFPQIETLRLVIRKMNPPLPGEVGYAQVVLSFKR